MCLQELNIDDVDKTMDEISEAQDQMQQMNDVLSQPIGTAADLDEDELAAELAVSSCILFGSILHALFDPCCYGDVSSVLSLYRTGLLLTCADAAHCGTLRFPALMHDVMLPQ